MWTKTSKEVLDKAQYIVPLKKAELQIKYAEALVRIDKAIEYIEAHKRKDKFLELNEWQTRDLLQILEDKEV